MSKQERKEMNRERFLDINQKPELGRAFSMESLAALARTQQALRPAWVGNTKKREKRIGELRAIQHKLEAQAKFA
jgi:hypothetical protein